MRFFIDYANAIRMLAFVVLAIGYVALPNARPDLTALNADDSEWYIALSYSLTHGLGYSRSIVEGAYIPHTTWPPGLPILLAPATIFATLPFDWFEIKLIIIVTGLLGVVLAWIYLRRMTGNPYAADVGAGFLALNPLYWQFSHTAMTEVPSIVFSLLVLLLVDIFWAGKAPQRQTALVLGLIAGLGMLIRGTMLGLALIPLAYLLSSARGSVGPRNRQIVTWLCYAAGFCVPFVLWSLRNALVRVPGLGLDSINSLYMLIASDATNSSSLARNLSQILYDGVTNIAWRIIYNIPEQLIPPLSVFDWRNWPLASLIAAALTALIAFAAIPRRSASLPILFLILPNIALLLVYGEGGAIRYWLPITSAIALILVIEFFERVRQMGPSLGAAIGSGILIVSLVSLVLFVRDFERHPYMADMGDLVKLYQQIAASSTKPERTLTLHGGVYSFMTGLEAPMTADAVGVRPTYTHIILRSESVAAARGALPENSALVEQAGAWQLYALPAPLRRDELPESLLIAAPVSASR